MPSWLNVPPPEPKTERERRAEATLRETFRARRLARPTDESQALSPQCPPKQRPPKRLDDLERFWDEQVGELPEGDVRSVFGNWVKEYGRLPVVRAIEKQAENESNVDSDDVFEAVRLTLRAWAKRGWCP